jgi:hypothetical protein
MRTVTTVIAAPAAFRWGDTTELMHEPLLGGVTMTPAKRPVETTEALRASLIDHA